MGASLRCESEFPNGWFPVTHADALKAAGVNLVALCDVNEAALLKARDRFPVRLYQNIDEMLVETNPDIVCVATRTPDKLQVIERCRGRAIYVEKPLANSLPGCRRSITERLKYGANRRYHHAYRYAKELIADGAIGCVYEIVFEFGLSPLLWCHSHTVDLATFFLGTELKSVYAELKGGTTDSMCESDPLVSYACFDFGAKRALITTGAGCNVRIHGSEGVMTIHADGASIQVDFGSPYRTKSEVIRTVPRMGATEIAIREMLAGRFSDANEIETGMWMLMACHQSNRFGRRVYANENLDDITVMGKTHGRFA